MGTSSYHLGVDEWDEGGVRYARGFRDQITLTVYDKQRLDTEPAAFPNHYINSRGELVASYPNAEARYREGDPISNGNGWYYNRMYLREDFVAPGWPPPPSTQPANPTGEWGYDDMGNYMDC